MGSACEGAEQMIAFPTRGYDSVIKMNFMMSAALKIQILTAIIDAELQILLSYI